MDLSIRSPIVLVILLILCAVQPSGAELPPSKHAGNMWAICHDPDICSRQDIHFSIPGVSFPQKGVLFAFGSFISPSGGWQIVDFDRHTATAINTNFDQINRKLQVLNQTVVNFDEQDLKKVISITKTLWNPAASEVPRMIPSQCTDSTVDLILFDGDQVLHYQGFCPPDGVAGEIEEWIHARLQHGP